MSNKDRLEDVDPALIQEAQKKLNKLCEEQNLVSFKITAGKAPWKELVLRMVGIPAVEAIKRGRKPYTEAEIEEIGRTVEILQEFENLEEGRKNSKKENYYIAAKHQGIEGKQYESGRWSNPAEIVRGIYNRYREKSFQKRLKQRIEEERKNWDEPDYP